MNSNLLKKPQWTTGARLLQVGELVEFTFYLPDGIEAEPLTIFPRYLELAEPGAAFTAGGDLGWLDTLESKQFELRFDNGRAFFSYQPPAPGNYIARWCAGDEVFYRYFAAIEDDWIVIRFSGYPALQRPTLHATGIPIDYPLPVERYYEKIAKIDYTVSYDPGDPLCQKFMEFHRYYGDAVVPQYPDTPRFSQEERVRVYGEALDRVKQLLPDTNDTRAGRVEMWHSNDPGYAATFTELGINSHFGLQMANGGSWLGMPEFPYFASPLDFRKTNQDKGGSVVANQWDFCTGWHFLGPVTWHNQFDTSENHWDEAERCFRQGVNEAKNLVEMSEHPAFLFPLYDAAFTCQLRDGTLRCPLDDSDWGVEHNLYPVFQFVERFQRYMAFEIPKAFKLVYARSLDIADYYRRHYKVTPRTVFVSKTDHIFYDMNWINGWAGAHILLTRERLPWNTRIPPIMDLRKNMRYGGKDPWSYEYIVVEDQRRSMRFERECLNPIWWFDYTNQEAMIGPEGSSISHVETPDVGFFQVNRTWPVYSGVDPARIPTLRSKPKWMPAEEGYRIEMRMLTEAEFPDYAIALWELPDEFASHPDLFGVETNAKEFIIAKNTDDEYHLVLFFDLVPDFVLEVTLKKL